LPARENVASVKEEHVRHFISCSVIGLLLQAGPVLAQEARAKATTPEIPYDSTNFIKMPADLYMGEGIGVATSSKGQVYVITRSGESKVFEFDPSGNFVKEFGRESYGYGFAHAVRVDKDDNVWSVDEGSNVILKFNPAGRLLMVLGKRPDPLDQLTAMPGAAPYSGANRPYSFHRPTDIAWDPQGNIFVSDGYTDSRIVKYDRNGRFIKSAGMRGNGDLQFSTPHGIAVDLQGNVYVADRGNRRIVVLDNDLNQKAVYDHVGAPWGICISLGSPQYLYSSNSIGTAVDEPSKATTGEIYKMTLDGKVVGRFGRAGKGPKEFASIHTMDCRDPNVVFTAEIQGWRVQKNVLRPDQVRSPSND
jgi:DNA-binding beta-propeller fold protein YncE